jgi:simple sugar transport system substrate-binding protein
MKRLASLLFVLLLVASFSGTVTAQDDARDYRIVVVTHGQAADSFWSVVKNGADQAGADLGVTVEYQAPATFDMVAMAQLIDAVVATQPDALVVSIPDADALGPSIQAAVEAGIPVISINSGSDVSQSLGALAHVGQTEYDAGYGGGQRMVEAGATHALCVIHEVGNAGLEQRCQGFTDAITEAGATVDRVDVDLGDPTGAANRIAATLSGDESIDAIMTLGPGGALPALQALTDQGLLGVVQVGTFDLSPEVLQGISDGNILFAIDQQQYMQGYLPIVYLTLYLDNLNTPGAFLIPTGPGFVTQENAAQVIEYAARGTR